ncbi:MULTISPECIES: O-methyltransferase [Streptomyces]|uniref:Class I SAM-dependent methyltransferase n=1 Tax=Streptomyces glycanivorans TaxID=3033808 RepID=A0ABY9JNY8_9ACTN|nr:MULTISPECIES: class I SAM-dependent methyltransferase [unclassified Streptomyces]WSQ81063.1 class I SAM-dependent methyltransferase [Streptomyces sp. NBC_01213]TXS10369.1 SAM-dependent methyltransferase [Streptomyces sp. wa22]WLQ67722.1 class I SAM-dependent methyltransferase [Streptomyces sp. Alt3]WSQ88393.1 class I SAM-dependent methyltransferase [Streptomyces sp. NBC_01212]WSR05600.1 class I SAM-dependent methyltransferase [Streptomyces sp. NBC_01208]
MEFPADQPMRVQATQEVVDYVVASGIAPLPAHHELVARTEKETGDKAGMRIAPEQGALITLLAKTVGARRAVEVGTFTGYSSLSIARALPAGGHLLCCDTSEEWTRIARDGWESAGLAGLIELRLGPALETLRSLPVEEDIDFSFVDADKTGYAAYFEELVVRTRPGGLIVLDNVLYGGRVLGDEPVTGNAAALREFNPALAADPRVDVVMLPLADGLTIARKR